MGQTLPSARHRSPQLTDSVMSGASFGLIRTRTLIPAR